MVSCSWKYKLPRAPHYLIIIYSPHPLMHSSSLSLLNSAQLIRLDAMSLQTLLQEGKLTSVQLVLSVLAQIERQDKKGLELHAMLDIVPKELLLERATQLDRERQQGKVRSPLHGIPITLKDCIATHPDLGLRTSVGSFALLNARPARSALVVDKLMEQGLIILGKANLTEFGNMKGEQQVSGYSSVGGQTHSAYVAGPIDTTSPGHPSSPSGSSTGSAVSVSAGYAPISVAEEMQGSIIQPASRAGLYALKPTIGQVPTEGMWTISSTCDALGPMAKSSDDLIALYNLLVTKEAAPKRSISVTIGSFSKLRIGCLDPALWQFPNSYLPPIAGIREQIQETFLDAIKLIKREAAKVVYPISLPLPKELKIDGQGATKTVFYYEYSENINKYLGELETTEVRTLQELVEWNEKHAELALPKEAPDQKHLLKALYDRPTQATYERAKSHMRQLYRDHGIDKVLQEHEIDLIAVPAVSRICEVASASGYPIATMPLGTLNYNGMPFGLAIITTTHREDLLFEFMKAFEAVFPERPIPNQLDNTDSL
jgi:amidase